MVSRLGAYSREPRAKTGFSEPWFAQLSSGMMRTEPLTQESGNIHHTALGLARLLSLIYSIAGLLLLPELMFQEERTGCMGRLRNKKVYS